MPEATQTLRCPYHDRIYEGTKPENVWTECPDCKKETDPAKPGAARARIAAQAKSPAQ